jgi:hypothetical protein
MPTDTDVKIAADLTEFRVETARRFEAVTERFGSVERSLAAIQAELGLIRKLGDRLLGASIAGVGTMFAWAALAGWYGSAINSRVEQHDRRLDKVEARLDGIDAKLDTLISRTAPAPPKAGG